MNPVHPAAVPPAAQIVITLSADGKVSVSGNVPTNELLVRGLLDKAKDIVVAHLAKQNKEPAIQVAPAGFLNGMGG